MNEINDNIEVSICCTTYNHVKYIRKSLESLLGQETDFKFEIIVHDDASTDGTQKIISELHDRCKGLIIPIFQETNKYTTIGTGFFYDYVFSKAKGRYIAICEGDDYWIDKHKIQKQFNYMESNKNASVCFHPVQYIFESNTSKNFIRRPNNIMKNSTFTINDVLLGGGGFMATSSMFFRKELVSNVPSWVMKATVGDLPLMLLLASKGSVAYISDVMGAYRAITANSWTHDMLVNKSRRENHYQQILNMLDDFNRWTGFKYGHTVFIKKAINIFGYHKILIYEHIKKVLYLIFRRRKL